MRELRDGVPAQGGRVSIYLTEQASLWTQVLERDGYRCQYPGCSVRAGLHMHHVVHRSRFGSKSEPAMNDPSTLVTLCWFHHRMLHAEVIGLTGTAPDALAWQRPAVMETATERHEALSPMPEVPNVWQLEAREPHYETTPVASG